MDIRQLQYYKEIVRQGNISKAAKALHIAQPPLSQLLKKLETELDTTLIHRYREEWKVTESGQLLYEYADRILRQMDDVKSRIHEIEEGTGGTVHIGVSSTCSNMLMDYIASFRERFAHIKINIISGDSESLSKKLEQREIDIALILKPNETAQYEMKKLKEAPAVLIVPDEWAGALSSRPALSEISDLPFIMLGAMEGHSFHGSLLKAFDAHGVEPNIVVECKDIPMAVSLVHRGLGISIIPRMHYQASFSSHLKIYELDQFDFSLEPVLMKVKDAPLSKAAGQFWEMVK